MRDEPSSPGRRVECPDRERRKPVDRATVHSRIEESFRRQARRDRKVRSAYLLVRSDRLGVDLRLAEGETQGVAADIRQPVHLASVGKLFTATVVALMHEEGLLSFDAPVSRYLDAELMDGLHVHRGRDYSGEVKVSHLLNQSSGLYDSFWPLLRMMTADPAMRITPREAVIWGREHLKPRAKPGQRHYYTDTNYYLLGLVVESITGRPFHETLHRCIFEPLGMTGARMMGYSEPAVKTDLPVAGLYIDGRDWTRTPGAHGIDYAGGGVIAPLEDYLKFMQALVGGRLVKPGTLQRMMSDDHRSYPTIRYGYAIWKFVTVPLLLPAKFNCWGCVGVTGAFMFYHPRTEAHVIGSFGDVSYRSKACRFMLAKVIGPLLKCEHPEVRV